MSGMELDQSHCYEALKARDARFDGRFFTCVKTTGVYCRPVCPARTPLEKNCHFVASAAAAQQAGFRPCLRCRPECAPGAPAWRGTGAAAGRALRMIAEGALDDGGVDALAERVGLGARHLRRLVRAHAGASPVEIARTRRILFAKRLIVETRLQMTDIAFAAGFGSLRRFNAEMADALSRAPRELRRTEGEGVGEPALTLPLSYRPPYDWDGVLAHLAMRAAPGLEDAGNGVYARRFTLGAATGRFEISHDPVGRALSARIEIDRLELLDALVARLRAMFDLDADPAAIAASLSGDPLIGPRLAAAPGLRLPRAFDVFEGGVRAILGQQVSVKGAATLLGRIVARAGGVVPTPEMLAEMDLAGVGLMASRIATLRAWARFASQAGALEALRLDPERAGHELKALPGFGEWTVRYLALRALGDADAFPASDLVLRKAAGMDARALETAAEAWRPWRSYAAQALWRFAGSLPIQGETT